VQVSAEIGVAGWPTRPSSTCLAAPYCPPSHSPLEASAPGSGFEGVLQELRDEYMKNQGPQTAKPLQDFDKMLLGMFNTMNQGFSDLEPVKNPGLGPQPTFVRDFLARFDAIFTLNQDTFLEQQYINSGLLDGSQGKWFACRSPGLLEENINGTNYAPPGIFRPADPPYRIQDRVQSS
jgi:hypothetical protein